jgi:hypothetical protein
MRRRAALYLSSCLIGKLRAVFNSDSLLDEGTDCILNASLFGDETVTHRHEKWFEFNERRAARFRG